MKKTETVIMYADLDDEKTLIDPIPVSLAYEGPASLIPYMNTPDIKEDILDLHNGIAYHFYTRSSSFPVFSVYTARFENRNSRWLITPMQEEDRIAVQFAISHYLDHDADDERNGELISLEKAVNVFLMEESEDSWTKMCLQLYSSLLNQAYVYLNSYEDDIGINNGMRLIFTSRKAAQRLKTASDRVLPLELLIRDIVQDDSRSRGLAIMSDNGWYLSAILPKKALKEVYFLYLSEIAGS